MSADVAVGVVANPASGRDIRRLVTGATVVDNAEKGSMVHRLMVGLGATGVDRVLMMPAGSGVSESLRRHLRGRTGALAREPLPDLEFVEMTPRETARDTAEAVERMASAGVRAIVVLGGDGTHRIVARHSLDIPVCALSTGTNNAFPGIREATVAGIATGLVATGRVEEDGVLRREKLLRVSLNGDPPAECALVDVAVAAERWVGSRAIWRPGDVSQVVVTFGLPTAVGFSAVAGLVDPVPRCARYGLHLRLADPARAAVVVAVPLAPGHVVAVGVAGVRRIAPGDVVVVAGHAGCLALDGEREIEMRPDDQAEIRLAESGLLTIDVDAVMEAAARRGLLRLRDGVAR